MRRYLILVVALGTMFGERARAQGPAIELSLAPDHHVATASIAPLTVFHIYVRNVGATYEFKYIGYDLSRPVFGSPITTLNVVWAPRNPGCDFPPWNSCIAANCASGGDYPILADVTFFSVVAIPNDTVFCIEPPTNSYVTPFNVPVYMDCANDEHVFDISGVSPSPGGRGCIVINPSTVPIDDMSWSAVKFLY